MAGSHSDTAAAYLSGVDLTGLAPEQALRLGSLVAELLEHAEVAGYRKAITALRDEAERQVGADNYTLSVAYAGSASFLEAIAEEGK